MTAPRTRTFRARLLRWFLGLFVVVQALALYLVGAAQERNARQQIDDTLEVGAGVFRRLMDVRSQRLVEAARLLSGDFAFKQAVFAGDRPTILSALENHRARIDADRMILASLDGAVLADTAHPEAAGERLSFAAALDAARERGEEQATPIVFLDGHLHQMVVVPLLAPVPAAWIAVGFRMEDAFVAEFRRLTLAHVSLLHPREEGAWTCVASTLPPGARAALPAALAGAAWEPNRSVGLSLGGEEFVSLVAPLERRGGERVAAVLQRSLPEALAPTRRLRAGLLGLFAGGVLLTWAAGRWVAGTVSRPVQRLAAGAQRVEDGDYGVRLPEGRADELGALTASFNRMVQGLAERDRVRTLLGKVVSPAIAQELLRKEIELGGEEREVTVLFADIRDFTAMCERRAPGEILSLLNDYLTRVTAVVEAHGGVVDKYIGDGLMALFGAPLSHPDDPARAVSTALRMIEVVRAMNSERSARGDAPLRIGVGIHTGRAVAGNMGSHSRLNYTVVGDAVNVASRIEGLTKDVGVPVAVSASTRERAPGFVYREIDRLEIRGRREPVTLFAPSEPGTAEGGGAPPA